MPLLTIFTIKRSSKQTTLLEQKSFTDWYGLTDNPPVSLAVFEYTGIPVRIKPESLFECKPESLFESSGIRNNEGKTALRHAELLDKRKKAFNLLKSNSKSEPQQSIECSNENEPQLHPENPDFIFSASSKARANAAAQEEKKPTLGFLY